jgi:hypothetical protein
MDHVINAILRQIPEFILNHTTKIATWRLCEIKKYQKKTLVNAKRQHGVRNQKT